MHAATTHSASRCATAAAPCFFSAAISTRSAAFSAPASPCDATAAASCDRSSAIDASLAPARCAAAAARRCARARTHTHTHTHTHKSPISAHPQPPASRTCDGTHLPILERGTHRHTLRLNPRQLTLTAAARRVRGATRSLLRQRALRANALARTLSLASQRQLTRVAVTPSSRGFEPPVRSMQRSGKPQQTRTQLCTTNTKIARRIRHLLCRFHRLHTLTLHSAAQLSRARAALILAAHSLCIPLCDRRGALLLQASNFRPQCRSRRASSLARFLVGCNRSARLCKLRL